MDSYYEMLNECYGSDAACIDFLWNCSDNSVMVAGSNSFFPENIGNPFRYMLDSGLVDESSAAFYGLLCSEIEKGIEIGTKESFISIDAKFKTRTGESKYYHIYADFVKSSEDKITSVRALVRPFTKKEEIEKSIITKFSSDKSPDIFSGSIVDMIKESSESKFAFIQFDIERFKLINDKYGTEIGDEILAFVNDSLNVLCSEMPHCRLTADVFMIVMTYSDVDEVTRFIRMIENKISGYKGLEYRIIFGVSLIENPGTNTRKYGDMASVARNSIKGNMLKNIAFYEDKMLNAMHHDNDIEKDMQKAIDNNEFVMFLQPKYCISTGNIIGAEALSRWIHPEKGMISPGEYIPVFEKNGFIIKLDEFMWESACRKIRSWIDKGIDPVPISVNVSREYLEDNRVVDILLGFVKKYDIPINLLELEITESMNAKGTDSIINEFKRNGFTMLMDDFGSGYSSLNTLKTTPFDVLKIDRGFLSEFMESERGRKIISHTISMSNDIGIDIIAEGVETSDQANFLKNCGCDTAQGFFYSKPVPHEEFDKMLMEK